MLQAMLNPYVLVVMTSLLTATLVTMYNRTIDRNDKSKSDKSFYKILLIGAVTGSALVFAVNRPDKVMQEPFFEDGVQGSF